MHTFTITISIKKETMKKDVLEGGKEKGEML